MNKCSAEALKLLNNWFEQHEGIAVAYSGGMDSAFLALAAGKALGGLSRAYLAVTEVMPKIEISRARNAAVKYEISLIETPMEVLQLEAFTKHPPNRCYLCKKHIFTNLLEYKPTGWILADGSNIDDKSDYRPGRLALKELGVASPLEECGFGKEEIREVLKIWNAEDLIRPPAPCLATRIPFGTTVSKELLARIEAGETILEEAGFTNVRLRFYGDFARIEVDSSEVKRLQDMLPNLLKSLESFGFNKVIPASEGYKRGAMNKATNRK